MLKNFDPRLENAAFFKTTFLTRNGPPTLQITLILFYSQTRCLPDRLQDGGEWSYSNASTDAHDDIVLEHILEKDKTQYSGSYINMHVLPN